MIALLLATQAAVAATPPVSPPPPGQWRLADRTNPAGIHSVSASVIGRDGVSRLVVKCDIASEPIVSVQFIWPTPLGQSPQKPVSVSFDGGMAFVYDWSFPGTGTYISEVGAVTRLTAMLARAKDVALETTSGNFVVQASFAAPGGDAMIRQVLGACGYTLGVVPAPAEPKAKAP